MSNDSGQIATVIGGSGFLGSHVADQLSRAGYHVRIYDRTDSPWKRKEQEMIVGDLLDLEVLAKPLRDQMLSIILPHWPISIRLLINRQKQFALISSVTFNYWSLSQEWSQTLCICQYCLCL